MLMINQSMMGIGEAGVAGGNKFSTTLYTPPDASGVYRTINVGKSGNKLLWGKNRESGSTNHQLIDSVRGNDKALFSNLSNAESTGAYARNFSGSTIEYYTNSADDIVIWTFLEAAGFFDIVSYTGNGGVQNVAHNLGITVGCMLLKDLSAANDWGVWHRSISVPATNYLRLNTSEAEIGNGSIWNSTNPTTTQFTVGNSILNSGGNSIIAYLFAHNPSQGIACGGFTTDGSGNATVNVGFRPQWLMFKRADGNESWRILDTVRGWTTGNDALLIPDAALAETNSSNYGEPTSTGFTITNTASSSNYIYIAID